MTEQPPEYMVLKKEVADRTDTSKLRKQIDGVVYRLFEACYSADGKRSTEVDVTALLNACDLLRCLERLLAGQDFMGAFGAPSDWGCDTGFGVALRCLYSDGVGNQILGEP